MKFLFVALFFLGCQTAPKDPDQDLNEARFFEIAANAETQSAASVQYIKRVAEILKGMVSRNLQDGPAKDRLLIDIDNVWLQSANELLKEK